MFVLHLSNLQRLPLEPHAVHPLLEPKEDLARRWRAIDAVHTLTSSRSPGDAEGILTHKEVFQCLESRPAKWSLCT